MKDNKDIQAVCDKCGAEFDIDVLSQNMKCGNKSINVRYFICPHCHALYVVSIIDDVLRYKMQRLRVASKKVQRAHKKQVTEQELKKMIDKCDLIRKDVKEYERALRNKYEKYLTVYNTEDAPQS